MFDKFLPDETAPSWWRVAWARARGIALFDPLKAVVRPVAESPMTPGSV